jgi:2,4-dienoyl-CoA reductase-like NADH-dependent reductase (Old Yellow Enzyme family)
VPLFDPLSLPRGRAMPNRFMLAPLTNTQSHPDGTLSAEEHRWLTMRAEGGFGVTTTAAAHVQREGQGFPGQLGVFSDDQLPGLTALAGAINAAGSLSLAQLYHAGNRSPAELIGTTPVCPSDDPKHAARGMTADEVQASIAAFAAAAARAERAGFDGVELHGAHGYLICQFLSSSLNHRTDEYGGSLENRSRFLFDILQAARAATGSDFIIGVRLSPERFGMRIDEIREVSQRLIDTGEVDFLDLSLWDCGKEPEEATDRADLAGRTLCEVATDLDRRTDPQGRPVPIGVAGKIHDPADIDRVLGLGADFPILGRVAILHHDYPNRLRADAGFVPRRIPVSRDYLAEQGVSPPFVEYLRRWPNFVAD